MQIAPIKPRHGEPCNGCGLCCAAERCPLAVVLIGDGPAPCPALELDEGRFWCGLIRNTAKYTIAIEAEKAPWLGEILRQQYFGTGCDSDDDEAA
jgi:hypothetical protein